MIVDVLVGFGYLPYAEMYCYIYDLYHVWGCAYCRCSSGRVPPSINTNLRIISDVFMVVAALLTALLSLSNRIH